jgi:hypothetical protein
VLGKDAVLTSVALLGDRISSLVLAGSLLFLLTAAQEGGYTAAHSATYATETDGEGSLSTPAIRLGAIAYYTSEAVNSTGAAETASSAGGKAGTGTSAMAWVGMYVPGLSYRTLVLSLLLELLAVCLNRNFLVCRLC